MYMYVCILWPALSKQEEKKARRNNVHDFYVHTSGKYVGKYGVHGVYHASNTYYYVEQLHNISN